MAPLMYVMDAESAQMVLLLRSVVAEKRVAVDFMTIVVWDVMFEEKKGRSDGLELNQTSSRTLLLDRRCMHPAIRLRTRVEVSDMSTFSLERTSSRHSVLHHPPSSWCQPVLPLRVEHVRILQRLRIPLPAPKRASDTDKDSILKIRSAILWSMSF